MSVCVITELHTKPGQSDALIAMLAQAIPNSHAHAGCEDIALRRHQDDPCHIASLTTWTTRRHYEDYLARRTERGDTDTFEALLVQPLTIHYYDAVEST